MVTFDALHSVKANITWLVETKKAHYIAVIKTNQPTAYAQLAAPPWTSITVQHTASATSHSRRESRLIKTCAIADNLGGIAFPHARLALRVHRRRKQTGRPESRESVYNLGSEPHQHTPSSVACSCTPRKHPSGGSSAMRLPWFPTRGKDSLAVVASQRATPTRLPGPAQHSNPHYRIPLPRTGTICSIVTRAPGIPGSRRFPSVWSPAGGTGRRAGSEVLLSRPFSCPSDEGPTRPTPYDLAMSYDIYFLSRHEGQSWEEALEATEVAAASTGTSRIPAELLAAWQRIVPQACALLGDVEITEHEQESRDLSQSDTGIDLSVLGDEVSITVPYWHADAAAEGVIAQLLALSAIVEKETGLTAYDPQIGMPLADASLPQATEIMSSVATDLRSRYGG